MVRKVEATTWVRFSESDEANSPIIRNELLGEFTELGTYYIKQNRLVLKAEFARYLGEIITTFHDRYGAAILNQVWPRIEWR